MAYAFTLRGRDRRVGLRMVEGFLHARPDAFLGQRLLVFLAQERIFQMIGDRGAAFGHVDRTFVGILLAGYAGLVLAMIVRTIPSDQTQRLLAHTEMRVEPVAAIGRGRHEADRLVVLPVKALRFAVLPGRHAVASWPRVSVAFALEADEYGRRHVRMRLGIAAGLVFADETIEYVV